MKQQANIVIIGAGIVGVSTAYHLAKLGWKEIVVIEQGPIFETGGSTSHAPGLVFQTNPSKTMCRLAQDTVSLYSNLKFNNERCYYPVGSLEVAWSPERFEELKRRSGIGKAYGLDSNIIDTTESLKLLPLLSNRILGSMFVRNDGIAKATRAVEAMAKYCQYNQSVEFIPNTRVTDIDTVGGSVTAVNTDKGRIQTEIVLSCAGIWGPLIGNMVGITIPQYPMQHCYAKTVPLQELKGHLQEVTDPILRHQDKSMYFRQDGDCYGIGTYRHEPLLVESSELLSHDEAPDQPAIMQFSAVHFEEGRVAAGELLPTLEDIQLSYQINGVFSFTIDGFPILGKWPQVNGFWSAEAVWITHAGGVGKVMAEWLNDGEPSIDLHECDVTRFHPHQMNKTYIAERASKNYSEVYDIIHPLHQLEKPRNMRLSPFYQRQKELGSVFFESSGWERPQWYESNHQLLKSIDVLGRSGWESQQWSAIAGAEHISTRANVGMFDLTPFTKLELTGTGSLEALEYLTTNRMDQPIGRVTYTSMLTHQGGIKCDLTVTRLGKNRFLIITGSSTAIHDTTWIRDHIPTDGTVQLIDVSNSMVCIGLWGPNSRDILSKICSDDLSNESFPYLTAKEITIGGIPSLALRISYVGELGWEIYASIETGIHLWDTLWSVGSPQGLIAVGSAAFDTLRLEKGYRLWGNELNIEYTPYEAGLGFTVRMNKNQFIGKRSLKSSTSTEIKRRLCCIALKERGSVTMGREAILVEGRPMGHVTSAGYGYSVDSGIAYGYLPIKYSNIGQKVGLLYQGDVLLGNVMAEPLFDPQNIRLRS